METKPQELEGVRFYRSFNVRDEKGVPWCRSKNRLEANKSDFDFIFSCIYKSYENKFVVNDQIYLPDQEEDPVLYKQMEACVEKAIDNIPLAFSVSVLEFYGPRMPEFDGNILLVMPKLPDSLDHSWFNHYEAEYYDQIEAIISNYDGAFWEIYASDKTIEQMLINTHGSDERLELYRINYLKDTVARPPRQQSELIRIS